MAASPQRIHITRGRVRDYVEPEELRRQTGMPPERFALVALKELLDNALDAAESVAESPAVDVRVEWARGAVRVAVADNGPGMPPELVSRLADFATRTSDKAAYVSPTRGALGNAAHCIVGMPWALHRDFPPEPVHIHTRGVAHALTVSQDLAGEVNVSHTQEPDPAAKTGTRWRVAFPWGQANATHEQALNPVEWVRRVALFNPHASLHVMVRTPGECDGQQDVPECDAVHEVAESYRARAPQPWRKWMPTDPTSAHWYSPEAFRALLFATVASYRESGARCPTVREWVRTFAGLTGTAKAKRVADAVGLTSLADFEEQPEAADALLDAMRAESRPIKATALGRIGEELFLARMGEWERILRHWYRTASCEVDGVPYTVEVFVAEVEECKCAGAWYGVNFSPTYSDPLSGVALPVPRGRGRRGWVRDARGIGGFLAAREVLTDLGPLPYRVAVHIVSPLVRWAEWGKSKADLPAEVREQLVTALRLSTEELSREAKAAERDAHAKERHRERAMAKAEKAQRAKEATLAEAVATVLPDAYEEATGGGVYPVSLRTLFYKVRDAIQALTSRRFGKHGYTYFGKLVPAHEAEHGAFPRLYYEPRGILYEPHTGRTVPLGTREVGAYEWPADRYDKVLLVEKKGLWPVIKAARLAERYDMAVIASEGYATVAARELLREAQERGGITVYVLHDADPDGYQIAHTLAEGTSRMPGHSLRIVDLGLTLDDARILGLSTEEFSRQQALPATLLPKLGPTEHEAWQADSVGRGPWACYRVELNAFSSPALVRYIEDRLAAEGVGPKVIPADATLSRTAEEVYCETVRARVSVALSDLLNVDAIAEHVTEALRSSVSLTNPREWVEEAFAEDTGTAWDAAVGVAVRARVSVHAKAIGAQVRREVLATVAEREREGDGQ